MLTRLHSNARPSPAADFTKFSIEHILPQAAIASDDDVAVIGSIGNLLFVDDDLNQKLGDKVFTQKTKILGKSETQYELSDVLAAHKWGKDEIDARARRLAETSYDSIWSL